MSKLRDMSKLNKFNDGTRGLFESIISNEVISALHDWIDHTHGIRYVLIGGMALSFHVRPRFTSDADVLFLTNDDIPTSVTGFRRAREHAFIHKASNVEVEVLTPEFLEIPKHIAEAIYNNSILKDGIHVATPSGLIASKLKRFSLQDRADIVELSKLGHIDLSPYPLPKDWIEKYEKLIREEG